MDSSPLTNIPPNEEEYYKWPSTDNEIWRHLSHYEFSDKNGNFINILQENYDKKCKLSGILLPCPGTYREKRIITFIPDCYSIEYGRNKIDPNRGLWVRHGSYWYKLEFPSPKYKSIVSKSIKKVNEYISFHDFLMNLPNMDYDSITLKSIINERIEDLFIQYPNKFNLKFIHDNTDWIADHLSTNFELPNSVFYESLVKISTDKNFRNILQQKKLIVIGNDVVFDQRIEGEDDNISNKYIKSIKSDKSTSVVKSMSITKKLYESEMDEEFDVEFSLEPVKPLTKKIKTDTTSSNSNSNDKKDSNTLNNKNGSSVSSSKTNGNGIGNTNASETTTEDTIKIKKKTFDDEDDDDYIAIKGNSSKNHLKPLGRDANPLPKHSKQYTSDVSKKYAPLPTKTMPSTSSFAFGSNTKLLQEITRPKPVPLPQITQVNKPKEMNDTNNKAIAKKKSVHWNQVSVIDEIKVYQPDYKFDPGMPSAFNTKHGLIDRKDEENTVIEVEDVRFLKLHLDKVS